MVQSAEMLIEKKKEHKKSAHCAAPGCDRHASQASESIANVMIVFAGSARTFDNLQQPFTGEKQIGESQRKEPIL